MQQSDLSNHGTTHSGFIWGESAPSLRAFWNWLFPLLIRGCPPSNACICPRRILALDVRPACVTCTTESHLMDMWTPVI